MALTDISHQLYGNTQRAISCFALQEQGIVSDLSRRFRRDEQ